MEKTINDLFSIPSKDLLKLPYKDLIKKYSWVLKKPHKITIKAIKSGKLTPTNINKTIHKILSNETFLLPTKELLIFHSLKDCFNFKKNTVKIENKLSIENACKKILICCNIFDNKKNICDTYFKEILDLSKLPYLEKNKLEKEAKSDLKTIENLINTYEEEKCVKSYILERQNPRNHQHRIFVEFYKRCLNEKERIINFLIKDIDEKAITYCRNDKMLFYLSLIRPQKTYSFDAKKNIELFDWTKINKCEHKFSRSVKYDDKIKLEKLYQKKDYKNFYLRLKRFLPFNNVFVNIFDRISKIPVLEPRKEIIKELELLFRGRKWYGYYSLALTQIEGIFSEMIDVIYKEKKSKEKKSFSALPDKVNALREYCWSYKYAFDYFQYYLPIQRNRFMHIGLEKNLKYESYGLLYDLNSVLNIFYELNTPYIELINIIERKDKEDFQSIKDFNRFYMLISETKNMRQKKIENKLNDYIVNFIVKDIDINMILIVLHRELENKFKNLFNLLQNFYKERENKSINIMEVNNGLLKEKLSIIKSIYEANKFSLNDDIKYIYEANKFIKGTRENILQLSHDMKIILNDINKCYKNHLEKFNLIVHNLKIEPIDM